MLIALEPGAPAVMLTEAKAALRLADDGEDALLAGQLRTATALCEAFTGQWLIRRAAEQALTAGPDWQRLRAQPVTAIDSVRRGGAAVGFAADIDSCGQGWVRLEDGQGGAMVRFTAGLAVDWNGVPEPLRAGIVRLASHFFSHRDAADAGPPPAAVAALWRPWRRLGI